MNIKRNSVQLNVVTSAHILDLLGRVRNLRGIVKTNCDDESNKLGVSIERQKQIELKRRQHLCI